MQSTVINRVKLRRKNIKGKFLQPFVKYVNLPCEQNEKPFLYYGNQAEINVNCPISKKQEIGKLKCEIKRLNKMLENK